MLLTILVAAVGFFASAIAQTPPVIVTQPLTAFIVKAGEPYTIVWLVRSKMSRIRVHARYIQEITIFSFHFFSSIGLARLFRPLIKFGLQRVPLPFSQKFNSSPRTFRLLLCSILGTLTQLSLAASTRSNLALHQI